MLLKKERQKHFNEAGLERGASEKHAEPQKLRASHVGRVSRTEAARESVCEGGGAAEGTGGAESRKAFLLRLVRIRARVRRA
eukprot:6198521-Pleurochrysis_carterae.AAC.1